MIREVLHGKDVVFEKEFAVFHWLNMVDELDCPLLEYQQSLDVCLTGGSLS
jgi:hypothetical protein